MEAHGRACHLAAGSAAAAAACRPAAVEVGALSPEPSQRNLPHQPLPFWRQARRLQQQDSSGQPVVIHPQRCQAALRTQSRTRPRAIWHPCHAEYLNLHGLPSWLCRGHPTSRLSGGQISGWVGQDAGGAGV